MILKVATLNIQPGRSELFEGAFSHAEKIISSMAGYHSHELLRCLEISDKYLLLVRWGSVVDHEEGFRKSPQYNEWKRLLHHFYNPFPQVEHYESITPINH